MLQSDGDKITASWEQTRDHAGNIAKHSQTMFDMLTTYARNA
jgi:hypothetical protein